MGVQVNQQAGAQLQQKWQLQQQAVFQEKQVFHLF